MNKKKRYIPEGVQDYLPAECFNKRELEKSIRNIFYSRGYDEVHTPIFENYDLFTGQISSMKEEEMYKIIESGNRILVLRPDVTLPIARMVSTKLYDATLPLRLSYMNDVYRYQDIAVGMQREIAQSGIELLGVEGPEGDAEIISIAIQCFIDIGLKDFQIDIGQVEFFKGLIEEANLSIEEGEELRQFIEDKNFLGLEMFLKKLDLPDELKEALLELPNMYGSIDNFKSLSYFNKNKRCEKAVENLFELYSILKEYGYEKYLTFDLGMVHSLEYYTGIIFRGFAKQLGFPLCGGGRYDTLLSEFSYDIPATGFAIGLKRLLMALDRQDSLKELPKLDILMVIDDSKRSEGYNKAKEIWSQGKRLEIFNVSSNSLNPVKYAKLKGIKNIVDYRGNELGDEELC